MDAVFEIFHIFYAKKRPIFGPPLFLGRRPDFYGDFTKFLPIFLTGLVPPPRDPNLLISPNLKCDSSLGGQGYMCSVLLNPSSTKFHRRAVVVVDTFSNMLYTKSEFVTACYLCVNK